jgi:hypothetical protein
MSEPLNDFPRLGLNTTELKAEVERLLALAADEAETLGAVNWGDLRVTDIEYRLSMLTPNHGPSCIVTVEEASPTSFLCQWLNNRLDPNRFPHTYIECEW